MLYTHLLDICNTKYKISSLQGSFPRPMPVKGQTQQALQHMLLISGKR